MADDKKKVYTLGLDCGTNSIGWAVIDQDYNLVKKIGHSLWGARMFEESSDAKSRRTYRNSRRRLQRRKDRIDLVRSIFSAEVAKVDPTFFTRLDESFFKLEDRTIGNCQIFKGGMTNSEYYANFPTIWHLRKYLLETDEPVDIRLLYLAVHHMIKYRGNFLIEGEFRKGDSSNLLTAFNEINDAIKNLYDKYSNDEDLELNESTLSFLETIEIDEDKINQVIEIINARSTKTDKRIRLEDLFEKKGVYTKYLIPLLLSGEVNLSSLKIVKDLENSHEDKEKQKINFEAEDFDNHVLTLAEEYKEIYDLVIVAKQIKEIKDYCYLLQLLGNAKYLSEAIVNKYNEHHKQLNDFKFFIKKYAPNKYHEIFRKVEDKLNNYPSYVGLNKTNKVKKNFKHCNISDFYAYIKKVLDSIKDEEAQSEIEDIKVLIENNLFLKRTNSSENASIPRQLHQEELKLILTKQAKYYPFLNEVTDDLSNIDKILAIFMFKRPYYVGPFNTNSEFSWIEKRNDEKIYPWNFEKVVDTDKTAIKFIERMQNKCSYLKGENDYCLPKNSIIFQEYTVLSYINKIKIGGVNIDNNAKLDIYNSIFLTVKKPTQKMIKKYLVDRYGVKESDITGIDDCNCSMNTYLTFKEIFGSDVVNNLDMIEDIIREVTIFEDKKALEKRLRDTYHLDEDKIKQIKGLSYKKYGKLCKNLLTELLIVNEDTAEVYHGILPIMRETTLNLQDILFSSIYNGNKAIDEYNTKVLVEDKEKDFMAFMEENITISPIFTRTLKQTMNLIDEIEDILGQKISYFAVECTRAHEKTGKTKPRYEQVKELLNNAKEIAKDFDTDLNKLKSNLESRQDVVNKADKLYLYFTQLGKDMYSLKDIDINDLDHYDIDHILPQSLIKDDSMSNRVLVHKDLNHKKSDKFLFEVEGLLNPKCYAFYKQLVEKDLISKKKFGLLTQKSVDEAQIESFVNRQKTATDQAVKSVITALKLFRGVDTEHIIYSKASIISDFRRDEFLDDRDENNIHPKLLDDNGNNLKKIYYKSRLANNYHHAHDAYLNAIIGKVLTHYYDDLGIRKLKQTKQEYFESRTKYLPINPMKVLAARRETSSGKLIWDPYTMLPKIEKNLFNNYDIQETTRTYSPTTMIAQVTIIPAGDKNPIKVKNFTPNGNEYDVAKYGGFKQIAYSKYCLIINHTKKGDETILQPIPKMFENNIDQYLSNMYSSYDIINPNIKTNVVLEIAKIKSYITGTANKASSLLLKNAQDRNFDIKSIKTIHDIDKYMGIPEKDRENKVTITEDKIILSAVKNQKEISITIEDIDLLFKKLCELYNKDIYSYSIIRTIAINLTNYKSNNFNNSNIKEKMHLCYELLKLLKTNTRETADLNIINMSKGSGELRHSITLESGIKLVSYSVTGLRKKVLYEVK